MAAITVENLSKCYRVQQTDSAGDYVTLRESLMNWVKWPVHRLRGQTKPRDDSFWALKDISFEVQPGEAIGIVGRNGAGKSTLLKILSRITKPSTGHARLRGRVGSLLEVGTGFHPELTGRENIYLNGSLLGMKGREIAAKFDEIVTFAEVERFIDTPVKRYSSGMYTRLAFAVAAHLEPEILVVDEVLAVGDAEFQKKCLNKMGTVASHGRTVLFVSHNMGAVQTLCRRGVLLSGGRLRMFAPVKDVIAEYLKVNETMAAMPLSERQDRSGDGRFRFADIGLQDVNGTPVAYAVTGEDCHIVVKITPPPSGIPMSNPLDVAVILRDIHGYKLTELATHFIGRSPTTHAAVRELRCRVPRMPLLAGQYRVDLWCGTCGETQDWLLDAATLRVEQGHYFHYFDDARLQTAEKNGCIMIPQQWESISD